MRYGIARPHVLDGTYLDEFLLQGLQWLTLCEFGSKRSCDSAKRATDSYNIPAMFLIGWLKGILEYHTHPDELTAIVNRINMTPNVAVILKPNEVSYYDKVLPKLQYQLFQSEDHYIDHIS